MSPQPPPPTTGPAQPGSNKADSGLILLTVISVLFLVGSLVLLTFAIIEVVSTPEQTQVATETSTSSPPEATGTDFTPTSQAEQGTSPTETQADPVPLTPAGVEVSNTREGVNSLACTGTQLNYVGSQLIDGDPNTGWGASRSDGSGQSASIDLGDTVDLTSVGIIPGYARVAPHSKADCETVSAFPLNRQIQSVRWTFDDGTSVEQDFQADPSLQTTPVDVHTRNVRLEILSTSRPSGADNDTIISEAAFEARP